MSEKSTGNKTDREIDLVDIILVLIKRKWIVAATIIAGLIIAFVYTDILAQEKVSIFKSQITITLPEKYNVSIKGIITTSNINPYIFAETLKKEFNKKILNDKNAAKKDYNYSIVVDDIKRTSNPSLHLTITDTRETIVQLVKRVFTIYTTFTESVTKQNKKIYNTVQEELDRSIENNTALKQQLRQLLKTGELTELPENKLSIVLETIRTLNQQIIDANIKKTINKSIMSYNGEFTLIENKSNQININKANVDSIEAYLVPIQRKKANVPFIIIILVTIFASLFLAFTVEFFSREDVKQRIRTLKK